MPKTGRYLLIVALVLLVLAAILRWGTGRATEADDIKLADWGSGDLKASEEAYYGDRISEIVNTWMQMGQRAEHDPEGRLREPYRTFLVIDCEQCEIRVEDGGHVLEEYRSELPRKMTWTLHHDGGSGASPLGPVVRLKYRGIDPDRQNPEIVWLVAQRPNDFLAFHFTCRDQGRSHIYGRPFQAYHSAPARKEGVEYYASILVNDAEYEQSRLSGVEAKAGKVSPLVPQKTGLDENRAAWSRVRKKLYQVIEGQVLRRGFHLRHLQVVPGPDYCAAHAEMTVTKDGLIEDILGRLVSIDPYLMIDYLGDDIWYARIVPNPQRPGLRPGKANPLEQLPLEFLVSAGQAVPSSERQGLIEKGRTRQRESTKFQPGWTITLPNGAVVGLIGVCECPSEGKRWWGPDGSPIDYRPCFARELTVRGMGDRKVFEVAWQVRRPDDDRRAMSVQHFFEDGFPFDARRSCDRYGVVLFAAQHYAYVFGKSQKKTTLRVDADLGGEGVCQVRFKNISLVPTRDFGFRIEQVQ
jgi:hypothetical protein